MKTTTKLLIVIQGILLGLSLFVINGYRISVNYELNDIYGLSENYVHYRNTSDKLMETNLLKIRDEDNYALISRNDNESFIGVYDPHHYFCQYKTDDGFGMSRGISLKEYKNKERVGIKVVDQNYLKCTLDSIEGLNSIAYCVDSTTKMFDENVRYYINVFALEYFGEHIYLDSKFDNLNEIQQLLINHNYELVKKKDIGIAEASVSWVFGKYTNISLGFLNLAMYGIYSFTIIFYFASKRNEINIHYFAGGTWFLIFYKNNWKRLMQMQVFNVVLLLIMYIAYQESFLVFMTFFDYFMALVMHFLIIHFIWFVGFLINYKLMIKGGAGNVK